MAELILEIMLLTCLLYPGAFVVWCCTAFRKPFREVLQLDGYFLGSVGLVSVALFISLILSII